MGDSLSRHGKRNVCGRVHPVRTQLELARGGLDAGGQAGTSVSDTTRHPLRLERALEEVDVASSGATGEQGMKDHYGTTVNDQPHGGREVALEANRKVMQGSYEELRREQDFVVLRQRRWCGSA